MSAPKLATPATPTLADARAVLRSTFGYPEFRPGQERAVESVLAGNDTLVILPTGGGKSLCYQVPALLLPGLTVVVSPLISLMKDQVDALVARGVPAAFVNSTLTSGEVGDRMARALRGDIKLLYMAPERFEVRGTAESLRRAGVSLLAIDEAHCISQWGHDFRPSYLRMRAVRDALGDPPTIALTATATPAVRRDIGRQLMLRDPRLVLTGFDRTNLTYSVVPARNDAEKDRLLAQLLHEREGLAVIYASTRRAVERIANMLEREGIPTAAYHAGLDDTHRHEVQEAFMREDVRAIVATNAFGMGIDKPNVRIVVHHAMPGTLEAYYQEAGRAGRDGLPSEAILLHAFPDRFTHEFFINGAYPQRELVQRVYAALQRLAASGDPITESPDALASEVHGKTSGRDVESALRVLEQGGAIRTASQSGNEAHVRLLATPDRIKRELGDDPSSIELGVLRALWRAGRDALYHGVTIDLASLPAGLGTPAELFATLESLQDRQFLTVERTGGGIVLTAPHQPLDRFPIDWAMLDQRRSAELDKLNAMQRYAYATTCRRAFVLRYFGDPGARPECEGCDVCLGTVAPRPEKGTKPERAPRERRPRERTSKSERAPDPAIEHLSAEAEARFEALRTLRREIAREEEVPAYIVFDDKTLRQIAVHRPRTLAAFGALRGIGPVKTEKFGARFLAALDDIDP
jgi:ATP-dependent DNA helicase RecQ